MRKQIITIMLFIFLSPMIFAKGSDIYIFETIAQEQRFNHLIRELRCVVCQNQSLAESNAPLAKDLRQEVYSKIRDNWTDEEIKEYLIKQYGNYILLKPILKNNTYVLWLGPFLFLVIGFSILYFAIKRQHNQPEESKC